MHARTEFYRDRWWSRFIQQQQRKKWKKSERKDRKEGEFVVQTAGESQQKKGKISSWSPNDSSRRFKTTNNRNNNYSGVSSSFRYVSLSCCVTVGGILRVTLDLFLLFSQHTISDDTERRNRHRRQQKQQKEGPTGPFIRRNIRRKKKRNRQKNSSTWVTALDVVWENMFLLHRHLSTKRSSILRKRKQTNEKYATREKKTGFPSRWRIAKSTGAYLMTW